MSDENTGLNNRKASLEGAMLALAESLIADGRKESAITRGRNCSEWVRDEMRGKSQGLSEAGRRILDLLDSAPQLESGLGDYQDKALAWDAVCVALNKHCPGWANNSAKTGLQSAVDAIAKLAAQTSGEGES